MRLVLALLAAQFPGDYLIHDIERRTTITSHWADGVERSPGVKM